ncbi:hypothetical protein FB451DRAFT_1375412 [Mycena latifolia]|nr:hypothetical protein FB451DRAFT_1375412 [Mycena latifolia]
MHPDLQLTILSEMMTALQARATAAIEGDLEVLRDLHALTYGTVSGRNLLPVYYAGLDASSISALVTRPNAFSNTSADREFIDTKLSHMSLCILGILRLSTHGHIPASASPDLWWQLWPWAKFRRHLSRFSVGRRSPQGSLPLSELFVAIICNLKRHDVTTKMIAATQGFCGLVFRMWALFLQDSDLEDNDALVQFCTQIVADVVFRDIRDFEVDEGAGGTTTSLASLVVKHIDCIAEHRHPSNAEYSILTFIPVVYEKSASYAPFYQSLLHQGVVKSLTAAALHFAPMPYSQVLNLFLTFFWHLVRYLMTPFEHTLIIQTSPSGLAEWLAPPSGV